MKSRIITCIVLLFSVNIAFAQSLAFATGEAKKGYSKVFANINELCNASVPLKEVNTNGGLDNITTLVDKGATVGISQIDTWQSLSGGDEAIGRLKAVASLNYNLMHIVVQKDGFDAGRQCTGKEAFGKCITGDWQPVKKVIEKESDLKGLTVAAVGSAQVLARTYLNKKLGLGIEVTDVDAKANKSGDQIAFEMLKTGKVQAVITMAAYPAGGTSVGGLKQEDGLALANFTQQVGGGFRVVKKNYKNIGAYNVPFLAVPNILWARPVDPNGPTGQQITALKACLTVNLKKFQDGEGFEPSWSDATLVLPDDVPAWTGVMAAIPLAKKK
jgi:ABC-type amino acid transport substrate-binding protein